MKNQALYSSLQKRDKLRIVVMRYRFIGDTVLLIPFLKNLRAALPQAVIDVVTAPDSDELLAYCPYINERIVYDRKKTGLWAMAKRLKQNKYDAAFVLKRSFSAALIANLAGIPLRIGFNTEYRSLLLTHLVHYSMDSHELDTFMTVLKETGFPVSDDRLEAFTLGDLPSSSSQKDQLTEVQQGVNALLHLTSSNVAKQWPEKNYVAFTTAMLQKYPQLQLTAVGAAGDKDLYERLVLQLPEALKLRLNNLCGQLSLQESWQLMSKLDFVIGVDSGTMHMMAAHHKPVITLFGPMSEVKWAPRSRDPLTATISAEVACRPCHLKIKCPHHFQCMALITPEMVLNQVDLVMNSLVKESGV